MFSKRTAEIDGELSIIADPPIIVPIEDLVIPGSEWENPTPLMRKLLRSYRRTLGRHHHPVEEYRYVHTAYKVVGVGSVGTRCWIMLLLGRDKGPLDPAGKGGASLRLGAVPRSRASTPITASASSWANV